MKNNKNTEMDETTTEERLENGLKHQPDRYMETRDSSGRLIEVLDKETVRKFLNMQYVKMKRMAAVGSLILLAINLSFTIYPFIEFRFPDYILGILPRAWIGVPLIFLLIIFLIWVGAHIYTNKMEMYRTEHLAERILNPYTVYAIGPFEEMLYRTMTIPTLRASYASMPEGEEKEEVKKSLDLAKKWVDLGYIPKEDFPKHLKKYYITNKEQRL